MRKKILFIMNNLNCGGAEKSLIALLENVDYSIYEVDLYLFKHEGIFMNNIPNEVNLLKEPEYNKYFDMSSKKAIWKLIKKGKIDIAIARILFTFILNFEKNPAVAEQKAWKFLKRAFNKVEKEYDVSIGYLEKNPIYFNVDKVQSMKKIGWIHTNYKSMGMDKDIDNKYFNKLNSIITVSDSAANILKDVFDNQSKKIEVIENIISPTIIEKMACINMNINFDKTYINIVTVGRLTYAKGYDLAIDTCDVLVNLGMKIRWYVIGEGEDRRRLEKLISDKKLNDTFILLGMNPNPYPYIKEADIYCQTSVYEGAGISISEAKVLRKLIIITNFESSENQITNEINGLIVERDKNKIASEIMRLLNDEQLRTKLLMNLKNEEMDNRNEIEKLYDVID